MVRLGNCFQLCRQDVKLLGTEALMAEMTTSQISPTDHILASKPRKTNQLEPKDSRSCHRFIVSHLLLSCF